MLRMRRQLFLPWLVWAAGCVAAMWWFAGDETIPYHLGYAGLAVAFGFDTWSTRKAFLALAGFTVVTGAVLVLRAVTGYIDWAETAEIPLMSLLMALMVWHVSNRNAALTQMTRLAEAEREKAKGRERMVRVTSHEMRTPLTIATGYVDLLLAEAEAGSRSDLTVVHEELDRVSRASDRLLRMIRYREDLPLESVDVDHLLVRLAERWTAVVPREWKVDACGGTAVCSEERVWACLDTLVENAVRYTEPGQTIRLFARREQTHVALGVADSGRGFDAQQVAAVNQPGELLSDAQVPGDARSQTGLGLSLVREVVESRGGTIWAGSAPEGGAVVVLRIPQAPDDLLRRVPRARRAVTDQGLSVVDEPPEAVPMTTR